MTSSRAQRRRQRSDQRRADAMSRLPEMQASENQLRNELKSLDTKAAAVAQHLCYERQLTEKGAQQAELTRQIVEHIEALTRLRVEIRACEAGFVTTQPGDRACKCAQAHNTLRAFAKDLDALSGIAAEMADLWVARAEGGAVIVDKEQIAVGVDRIIAELDRLTDGLEVNRRDIVDLCGDSI